MKKKKTALITGITGQDGSYLAELLLGQEYEVHGFVRRIASELEKQRFWRINHIKDKIVFHYGTIQNYASIFNVIQKVKPDECYHLAAQSFVHVSFDDPFTTMDVNVNGTLNVLQAVKEVSPRTKVYFAGSSEMFGKVEQSPQNEKTPFYPRSPYGVSKVAGFDLVRNYREAHNIFACSGILFNHESPRRGEEFVTRKITLGAARIKQGLQEKIHLGNLNAERDWGHAKDYVRAMYLMLQQQTPQDFVIATGVKKSIKNFLEKVFQIYNLDWKDHVEIDTKLYRPSEVNVLLGDYSKAKTILGWEPEVTFDNLVYHMTKTDQSFVKTGVIR